MDKKTRPIYMLPPSMYLRWKHTHTLKVKGWKKIFHANGKVKKAGVAVLLSDKIDLKPRLVRDKEGPYIMIKGTIQQEDTTLVNIYIHNIGAPKYVKQIVMDIKGEIDRNSHSCGF